MRSHGTRARTPQAYARSRRGGLTTTASAALVCLGALLTAGCGGGGDDGYVAVGAAEPSQRDGGSSPSGPVRPDDKVRMVPLEPPEESGSAADEPGGDAAAPKGGEGRDDAPADGAGGADAGSTGATGGDGKGGPDDGSEGGGGGSPGSGTPSSGDGGSTTGGGGGSPSSPGDGTGGGAGDSGGGQGGDAKPSGPAALKVGEPRSAEAEDRWCEKVTVQFRNTGGSPVKKGTVTLSTHIIGSLGVDWDTRTSTRALPAPLGAGAKKDKTWNVCVDKWRVPLGMHIETREVRVSGWK